MFFLGALHKDDALADIPVRDGPVTFKTTTYNEALGTPIPGVFRVVFRHLYLLESSSVTKNTIVFRQLCSLRIWYGRRPWEIYHWRL
jgi:hypothetical protein